MYDLKNTHKGPFKTIYCSDLVHLLQLIMLVMPFYNSTFFPLQLFYLSFIIYWT